MFNRSLKWKPGWSMSKTQGSGSTKNGNHHQMQVSTTCKALDERAALRPHLSDDCKQEFLSQCWQLQLSGHDEDHLRPFQTYFRHYEESCYHLSSLLDDCTHQHFCQIAQVLAQGERKTCETKIDGLLKLNGDVEIARECIDFVGKAIFLLNLGKWREDETLADYIARKIATSSKQTDQFRLPVSYNARNFEKLAGVSISWTRDLLQHLQIGSNDSTMEVFHMVTVFDLYEKSALKGVFPVNFLDETRRTISLMLPDVDPVTRKWYQSEQGKWNLDPAGGTCAYLPAGKRHIQKFNFWRDRLIIAKETFDLSQPKGLKRFWRDDRNPVQWWTFWIAIVVFLLTVIGVVEGALQVYKAYHPS